MSKLLFRLDYPRDKACVVSVDEKTTFAEVKAAAAKSLEVSLKDYSYICVGFRVLPKDLSKVEDKTAILDKSTGVTAGSSIVALAPAYIKPLIKRVQKKKEDEKKKSSTDASVYKQFTIQNIFKKIAGFVEKKDAKNLKFAHEYVEMFGKDIFKKNKEWTDQKYELVEEIVKSDKLNAKELEVFDAVVAWGEAECKRQKLSADKPEDLKKALKGLFALIRFPCMGLQDIAVSVEKTKLLEQQQLLALFTYLGQKSSSDSKPTLDDCLKGMITKERKGRTPFGVFSFDSSNKGSMMTLSNDDKTVKQTSGSNQWNSVCCKEWVKSGVHVVKMRIDGDSGSHWLFLGVVARSYSGYNDTSSGYIGHDSVSWGFSNGGGYPYAYSSGSSRNYGTVYRQGDVITMTLDMDNKNVSYKVNDNDYSVCFTGLPDEVTVAVTTYDTGDSVTLAD
jgi:hypothetical protein